VDTASYSLSTGVVVDLGAGTATLGDAEGDTLTGIEQLVGSDSVDGLAGDADNNTLLGAGGDDSLYGHQGPTS
jgi:Ca2+-binding RTX toxin-like protein